MKKFINNPKDVTTELLEGFALANDDLVRLEGANIVVSRRLDSCDRVTIVTIGGSGHEPALIGFVGEGMIDVAVAGDIFTAPGADAALQGIRLADRGHGVLFIVLNHTGDRLTGNLAMEACAREGMDVRMVVTRDDISGAPRFQADARRGLVGCIPLYKIAGAAAAEGKSLDEVGRHRPGLRGPDGHPGRGPQRGHPPHHRRAPGGFFRDDMEIGMGQHGEEGGGRQKLLTADETALIMVKSLLRDLGIRSGEKVMLILDGTGATTLMELFIVYRRCVSFLDSQDIEITANKIGELLTVQEAAGFPDVPRPDGRRTAAAVEGAMQHPYFKQL